MFWFEKQLACIATTGQDRSTLSIISDFELVLVLFRISYSSFQSKCFESHLVKFDDSYHKKFDSVQP